MVEPLQHIDDDRIVRRLEKGAAGYGCGVLISALDPLVRSEIYTKLVFERLERKVAVIDRIHCDTLENWNATFYNLYFRTLGDRQNQAAFMTLASRVRYNVLLRERLVPNAVEAMLLGTSGLLSLYGDDSYIQSLKALYFHLSAKYELEPMDASEWSLSEIRPANHPVLRIAQAAEFFRQDDLLFDRVIACRTDGDVHRLFCIESSPYWRTHYIPGVESDSHPKRIGHFKSEMIGINMVAILQFTYGSYVGREELRERALDLLEAIPAEDNRYMRSWFNGGLHDIRDAFESQALLQLATEYCAAKRCRECHVCRHMIWEAEKEMKIG